MKPKVYVVDDEPTVRHSVAALFSACDTKLFESTEDFLASFDPEPDNPSCVIADLRMPGLSGLDLKRALNEQDCDIPVILLTGYRDDETDVRAEALGIFRILEKPFPPTELVALTQQALSHSSGEPSQQTEVEQAD